jgi:GPH family glycoside/pentoside/hexuronide:cation symporter
MSQAAAPLDPALALPSNAADASNRLPVSTFVAYGLPRFAMGLVGVVVSIYFVNFGTDVLLIAPYIMGWIQAGARIWDGVTDPVAGYLSDRTRSRFGRRRSWLYVSALPMMLAVILMWSPPAGLDAVWIIVWMAAAYIFYETVQDVFLIPHGALGVELSESYHERTRVFAWQHLFLALGTLFGLAALEYVRAGDPRERVQVFAVVGGAALCATILYAAWKLPERASYQGRGATDPVQAFRDVLRNPHARPLIGMYAIETIGVGAVGSLTPFMARYVYGDTSLTTWLAGAYLLPQALLTPLWIALAGRIDKKKLWLGAMVVTCCGSFVQSFLPGDVRWLIIGVPFVLGIAAGVGQVCAPAIKADIIDYDELQTDQRKEGAYLAVWNFVRKSSAAITPVLALWAMDVSGFQPNVAQNESTQWVIRFFFGMFPGLCFIGGICIFLRFRFTQREHAEIRRALDARRLERGV